MHAAMTEAMLHASQVHLPPYSGGFTAIIALDNLQPGEAKNVALAAIDIFDPADAMWALATGAHTNDLDHPPVDLENYPQ